MSRLRTSTPWTTPTTPLGARILSEEPATVDAIPTMTLAEMEAALAGPAVPEGPRPGRHPRSARRLVASARQVAAAAAVLVALAGCAGGLAVGAGRPSRMGPAASASAASEPGVGAAWGEAVAQGAAWGEAVARGASVPALPAGPVSTADTSGGVAVLPASVERVDATVSLAGGRSQDGAAAAIGAVVGRSGSPSTTTLASVHP